MAKVKKPGENNELCEQSQSDERYLQKEVSPLDGKVTKKYYAMRITTLLNAVDVLSADLEYLAALTELPDPEFLIKDAVAYSRAVVAISNHINFVMEDISTKSLSEDENHVKLTEQDVVLLDTYNTATEDAIEQLELLCGISLRNN